MIHSSEKSHAADLTHGRQKTKLVLLISFTMTLFEISYGYWTHSMALLADGWHMATHVFALLVSYLCYWFVARKKSSPFYDFGTYKVLSLGSYTNAILLGGVAVMMSLESTLRLWSPTTIQYREALIVTSIGLLVNVVCVFILKPGSNHGHHDHDPNLKSAYFHILSDLLTSITAIAGIYLSERYQDSSIDAWVGLLGSVVILKWAFSLGREAFVNLLNGQRSLTGREFLKNYIEELGVKLVDLRVWPIAPFQDACALKVEIKDPKQLSDFKQKLEKKFTFDYWIIENLFLGEPEAQKKTEPE